MARKGNGTSDMIVQASSIGTTTMLPYSWHFLYKGSTNPLNTKVTMPFCISAPGAELDLNKLTLGFSWSHPNVVFRQAAFQRLAGGLTASAVIATPLVANTWYGIGATWDGTSLRVYLNGTLEATSAVGSCQHDAVPFLNSALVGSGQSNFWDAGTICEVGSTFGVVSAGDMQALAAGVPWTRIRPELAGFGQQEVLYWPLLGDASPEPDYGAGHRPGTLTGTTIANHPSSLSLTDLP